MDARHDQVPSFGEDHPGGFGKAFGWEGIILHQTLRLLLVDIGAVNTGIAGRRTA
jgi:hypothetical protein